MLICGAVKSKIYPGGIIIHRTENDKIGEEVVETGDIGDAVPVITVPVTSVSEETVCLLNITRRSPMLGLVEDLPIAQTAMDDMTKNGARNFVEMQELWQSYVNTLYNCCPSAFWNLLEAVKHESVACRDRVFAVVKKTLQPGLTSSGGKKNQRWPETTKTLRALVHRKAGVFWDHVMESHTVDISKYNIPGCATVVFESGCRSCLCLDSNSERR